MSAGAEASDEDAVESTTDTTEEDAAYEQLVAERKRKWAGGSSDDAKASDTASDTTSDRASELRGQGNASFKKGNFSFASDAYTAALGALDLGQGTAAASHAKERVALLLNRAACHLRLRSHPEVEKDCIAALKVSPCSEGRSAENL
jgi:hypothetical protein